MKWICTDGNADIEIESETAEEAAQEYVDTGEQGFRSTEYRDADSDSLEWIESQRVYRLWFRGQSIYDQRRFTGRDAKEVAERYGFSVADLGPGCDIEIYDDDDEVIGGVVEEK